MTLMESLINLLRAAIDDARKTGSTNPDVRSLCAGYLRCVPSQARTDATSANARKATAARVAAQSAARREKASAQEADAQETPPEAELPTLRSLRGIAPNLNREQW